MKITEIIMSTSLKFQTLPYSNQDIFISAKASLDESDDPVESASELGELVKQMALEDKAVWDDVSPSFYDKPSCLL